MRIKKHTFILNTESVGPIVLDDASVRLARRFQANLLKRVRRSSLKRGKK